ncbi:MAG: translocation/assembly module TamB domain-containing protein [Acidobacteria bacterium]|nr:translocation/assembly module TamB domain-containing protein [Acidobacteriota bacterium]
MTILRRVLQVLLLVATLIVGAAAAAIVVSQTAWFRSWLRGFVVQQANQYLNGTLSIGSLGGNLFFGVELSDVGLEAGGERVVSIRNAGIDYSAIQLISGNLVIDHVRLDQPSVLLERTADGWNLASLIKRQEREQERTGPGRAITVGEIGISDGTVRVREQGPVGTSGESAARIPRVLDRLNASLRFEYEPVHYTARIGHLSFRASEPDIALNDLSGTVSQRDDDLYLDDIAIRTAESSLRVDGRIVNYLEEPVVELSASSDKLDVAEMGRVFPAAEGIQLQPSFQLKANGPLGRLGLDFGIRSSAGDVDGQLTANLAGETPRVAGVLNLRAVDLAPVVRNPAAASDLTGTLRLDLALPPSEAGGPAVGTFAARLPRAKAAGYEAADVRANGRVDGMRVRLAEATARAYGATARLAGLIVPASETRGTPLTVDLSGSMAGLDLRRLPADLDVPRAASRLDFDYQLAGTLEALRGEARLRESMLVGATLAPGTTASFSRERGVMGYTAQGAIAGLDLQQAGQEFAIEAMAADRFRSHLNGRFSIEGRGTEVSSMTLNASAVLEDSTLAMAKVPALQAEAHLEGGAVRVRANGEFAGVDPAVLSGRNELAGELAGRLNLEAGVADVSAPVSPESVTASGRVELGPSKVGSLSLDQAVAEGEFSNATAQLERFTAEGPDVEVKASGTLALGTFGESDLQYQLGLTNLSAVGQLAGQQQVQGSLSTEGRVTGNRTSLRMAGSAKGTNVGYGDTRALSVESTYDVQVPNFDAAAARATAETRLMFALLAGEELTRLRARTAYADKQLEFEGEAQQAQRQAQLAGRVVLHPDHQEVHVASFGLVTQGMKWALAPGSEPAIEYGGDRILVEGLTLTSGPQRIEIDGTIGKTDSRMRAALTNVDIARLDTWLVGERRLGGVLNASARITGPQDSLRVDADFSIDNGSFRNFQYQSLAGTAGYTARRMSLDARLQQGPATWLVARGTVPTSLFQPSVPGKPAPPGADDPVDFTLQSSSVDLGLVQGFTTAVDEVSGNLRADVRVSGTASAPTMNGFVEVAQGRFNLLASGVTYSNLEGRVVLQGDRAVIERLRVVDEHERSLTMAGEVAVHGTGLGEVTARISGDGLEVLHNDLGRLAGDARLDVSGTLQAPRVAGEVTLRRGEVDLDEWLQRQARAAYATAPTRSPAAGVPGTAAAGSPARATSPAAAAAPEGPRPSAAIGEGQARPVPAIGEQEAPVQPVAGIGVEAPAQPGPGQAAAEKAPATPFDAAELNVRVRIPDVLLVRGDDLRPPGGGSPIGLGDVNITAGGDLRVEKPAGEPMRIIGDVRTVRGTYDFQGRRFDLQRDGRVRFEGVVPLDPSLDFTATRLISSVEVQVRVGGTMSRPELTLTSRPPLEEADILSLIVFNQSANQLEAGQQVTLAQRASALATGFVAGKLADSLGRALDLDIFEIEAAPQGPGQGASATVTVGEQVGERLFLRLRQGVGADTTRQFIMEYQLLDFLRLETTVSQGGAATRSLMRRVEGTGLDLIFFFDY